MALNGVPGFSTTPAFAPKLFICQIKDDRVVKQIRKEGAIKTYFASWK